MNCPRCNTVNENDSKFCFSCGYNLSGFSHQENVVSTPVQTSETLSVNVSNNNSSKIYGSKNKSSKNLLIVIVALVAIVVVGFVCYKFFFNKDNESKKLDNLFDPNELIKVKKDEKYGFINTKGKFVLEANYESASDFNGDYAIVTVKNETGAKVYQLIDKKGVVKVESASGIKYVADYDIIIANDSLYNNKMKKLNNDNVKVQYEEYGYLSWKNYEAKNAGIMKHDGKITYTYNFTGIEHYFSFDASDTDESLKERYCRVNIDNDKYAIVNCDTGALAYDFTEYYVSEDDDNVFRISNHSDFSFVAKVYIQNNKVMYQVNDSGIDLDYYPSGNYFRIRDYSKDYDNRYSYLNVKTGEITNKAPDNVVEDDLDIDVDEWEALTNNKKFSCSDGYGLMNNENVVLSCEWDDIEYLDLNLYKYLSSDGKNYIYAKKDSKWNIINLKDKKVVTEFNTSYLYTDELSTFIYYTDKDTNTKFVYNLLTGKSLEVGNNSITKYSNYITVKNTSDKTINYYNVDLQLIYTENY